MRPPPGGFFTPFCRRSVKPRFYRIAPLRRNKLHVVPVPAETHTIYSGPVLCAGSGRASLPAAPFGKTPARAGFPECDLPPAEFFFLLFYRFHIGNVELENVISYIKPVSAFRSKLPVKVIVRLYRSLEVQKMTLPFNNFRYRN